MTHFQLTIDTSHALCIHDLIKFVEIQVYLL